MYFVIVESCCYYGDLIRCSHVPVAYVFMLSCTVILFRYYYDVLLS